MQTVLLVIHLIVALSLIGVILLQRSEGGALGMGGSGSGNIFSARGVGNALTRTTAILAVCFFVTSISLALYARHASPTVDSSLLNGSSAPGTSVLPQLPPAAPATPQVPVTP